MSNVDRKNLGHVLAILALFWPFRPFPQAMVWSLIAGAGFMFWLLIQKETCRPPRCPDLVGLLFTSLASGALVWRGEGEPPFSLHVLGEIRERLIWSQVFLLGLPEGVFLISEDLLPSKKLAEVLGVVQLVLLGPLWRRTKGLLQQEAQLWEKLLAEPAESWAKGLPILKGWRTCYILSTFLSVCLLSTWGVLGWMIGLVGAVCLWKPACDCWKEADRMLQLQKEASRWEQ
ncbi:hypothetical protein [Candidatus Methylacidithermus pantelleriae]|uniref:hypothetical protein n=1 Tax=Candidatus Methylacidithermus pantelleriae TaxID=2744239 RepID=UPI00157C77D6|nr:hypothetical protein [Candidatus Methylacidithermus pantelleriae]